MSDAQTGDRRDWTPTTRLAVANRMRELLKDQAGLRAIAQAAAKYFVEAFGADSSGITLMRGVQFRTLVTVGEFSPGELRYPDMELYPTSTYPHITPLLKAGRGYVSSIGNPGGIPESEAMLNDLGMASCIGAPITYSGEVLGEMFVSRRQGVYAFTGKDLAVGLDLARQLGLRLGPAVKAQDANNSDWWPLVVS